MKFITNRISTGKTKSFSDLVDDYRQEKEATVKTASVVEEVKVAEAEKDEADSSGQPEWEGKKENVNDPQPCDEKEASSDVADKDNENNSEADSSGQPEWEGKQENVNNPKKDCKEAEAEAKAEETEVKEAAGLDNFGDKKAEPFGKKEDSEDSSDDKEDDKEDDKDDDKEEDDDKDCKASEETETKVASEETEAEETKDETKEEDKKEEEKEASAPVQFVKTANLDGKSKAWLRKYWGQLYPQAYADAMTADK